MFGDRNSSIFFQFIYIITKDMVTEKHFTCQKQFNKEKESGIHFSFEKNCFLKIE